jgi:hypothetical protein
MLKAINAIWFTLILTSTFSFAQRPENAGTADFLSGGIDASYYSSYIWRGITLDKGPVFQPAAYSTFNNFTFTVFSNLDDVYSGVPDSNNLGASFDYTRDLKNISVSAGYIYYPLPEIYSFSREYYAGIRFTKIPAMPYILYYYDDGPTGGTYISAEFTQRFQIFRIDKLNTSLGLHIGYNNGIIVSGTGTDVGFLMDIGYPVTNLIGGSLVLGYVIPYGGLKDTENLNQSPRFYSGVRVGF